MTNNSKLFALIISFLLTVNVVGQENGTVLVIVNSDAEIMIDGENKGSIEKSIPIKYELNPGEHYVQALVTEHGLNKGEIVTVEAGKQKILKIDFELKETANAIKIADVNFNIPGIIVVTAWMTENPDETYPDYPQYLYAFEEGDEITINCKMSNLKGTNVIEVTTYPDKVMRYSNNAFTELNNIKIKVEKRGIYKFDFATNHILDRTCFLTIERTPASQATANFNTSVKWEKRYTPVSLVKPQESYINSGSNASLLGGKSRIVIPVSLPPNTEKWYYTFSASREESDIASVASTMDLVVELTELIDNTGGLISFGVNQLTQPPGADFCDIYLLNHENSSLFKNKEAYRYFSVGTRENHKSGVVEIDCCNTGMYYLGLKNPDSYHGINTVIEVVAITYEEGLVFEE